MSWDEAIAKSAERGARLAGRESDLASLGRLADADYDLEAGEAIAFREMREWIEGGERRALSAKQRKWVAEALERVQDIAEERGRPVPSGRGIARSGHVHDFERMARPLKPPGRS